MFRAGHERGKRGKENKWSCKILTILSFVFVVFYFFKDTLRRTQTHTHHTLIEMNCSWKLIESSSSSKKHKKRAAVKHRFLLCCMISGQLKGVGKSFNVTRPHMVDYHMHLFIQKLCEPLLLPRILQQSN